MCLKKIAQGDEIRLDLFVFFFLLLLFGSLASGFAIEEPNTTWRYTVLRPNTTVENPSLPSFYTFSDELLQDIQTHESGPEEVELLKLAAKDHAIDEKEKEIITIQQQIDNLIFEEKTWLEIAQERASLSGALRDAKRERTRLTEEQHAEIDVLLERPVENVPIDQTSIAVTTENFLFYAKLLSVEHNLQQVFFIDVVLFEEYRIYTIIVYNSLLDKSEILLEEIVLGQDTAGISNRLILPILFSLRGRETVDLTVQVFNQENSIDISSEIIIDGEPVGFGNYHNIAFSRGKHTIVARFATGREESMEVDLLSGETRKVFFYDEDTPGTPIQILSFPLGASVYKDSLYMGVTPLNLERPKVAQYISLQKDGYTDAWTLLETDSSDIISIALQSNDINTQEELKAYRDRFYVSVAIMAATVPFPIVFSALYRERDPYLSSTNLTQESYTNNKNLRDTYYYSFWGSLALNLAAITYMGIRLGQYVNYSNSLSEDWNIR